MIRWFAVMLSIVFLIVMGWATATKFQAEKYAGLAAVEEARGIAYAREIAARGDAAIGLKQAQAQMLLAALPYFLAFGVFLFLALVVVLIVRQQPGVTNNYIVEVLSDNQSGPYFTFDRLGRRVRLVGGPGRQSRGQSTVQHRRLIYDQEGVIDEK